MSPPNAPNASFGSAPLAYEIGKEIARGGMGSVREAQDRRLGRTVAVKVMLAEAATAADRQRFAREASVLAQLAHPNIVPIHEFSQNEAGLPFYSMKLVRGVTLQTIIDALRKGDQETRKHYTLDRLLTIFRKVCDAIAFAHSRHIVHRDLKPDNIMVGEFGEVQVMDWGLAKLMKGEAASLPPPGAGGFGASRAEEDAALVTLHGEIMGTPRYMAPEQAAGKTTEQDERTDVFALGGILYALLTLRPPVEGKTVKEVLNNVTSGVIVPPASYGTTQRGAPGKDISESTARESALPHCPGGRVPRALSAVAMKALSVAKEARYATVAALASEVEAYQGGFATSAENAGLAQQVWLLIGRHRAVAASLCAMLAVGGFFGVQSLLAGRRAEHALAELKKTAPALRKLAESEAGFQRFDSALSNLDAALSLDPEDTSSWWQRAWLFIGMERWMDAAAALRVAQTHEPSRTDAMSVLPLLESFATLPENLRWTKERTNQLADYLERMGASGPLVALSKKLALEAEPRRKLVVDRMKQWLGDAGMRSVSVTNRGRIAVNIPSTLKIDTVEPLRGLPVDELIIIGSNVTTLEPLRDARLSLLNIRETKIRDLSPLKGMPVENINVMLTEARDLSPLAGAPLVSYNGFGHRVLDFKPLRGTTLRFVLLNGANASDLDFLKDAPIEELDINGNQVADLAHLHGKPIKRLLMNGNLVKDLSPLRGTPLQELSILGNRVTDFSPLIDCKRLERINTSQPFPQLMVLRQHPSLKLIARNDGPYRPVAEFWKEIDDQKAAAEQQRKQAQANRRLVADKLVSIFGPEMADRVSINNENEVGVDLKVPNLKNLDAIRGLPVQRLNVSDTSVEDISALRGMNLTFLNVAHTKVADLSPLTGMKLKTLNLAEVPVKDMSPLKGMALERAFFQKLHLKDMSFLNVSKLKELDINQCNVGNLNFLKNAPIERLVVNGGQGISDLSPLRGKPLVTLHIGFNQISDLSPLIGLPIVDLIIDGNPLKDLQPLRTLGCLEKLKISGKPEFLLPLRAHPTLKWIAVDDPALRPVTDFWRDFDARQKSTPSPSR